MDYQNITHPISPIYDNSSKILILGSFPSVKSREQAFYYGHPQNRFWKVMSCVCNTAEATTIAEKTALLLDNNIAVWDVIHSCDIVGSADSTIKNVVPNDLREILCSADIKQIFVNGKTAEKLYNQYIQPTIKRSYICLPSTSPANARWNVDTLSEYWGKYLKEYI